MSYDSECEELATHFLGRDALKPLRRELAQHIQDAVETWINYYHHPELGQPTSAAGGTLENTDAGKPHKGKISDWLKMPSSHGLGYYIVGQFHDHPEFGGKFTNTSWVEKHDLVTGEVETRNSRYTLVGPEAKS
jgi:hypothetical protein